MVRHAKKHAKKSTRRKRGGINLPVIGEVPIKKTVADFIGQNSFIEQVAPTLASMGPDYAPSKFIAAVDLEPYFKDYPGFLPAAKEFQDGLVEGLQQQGIGRRRRRGYIVMRKKAKGPKKSHKRKGRK
jgi:hypothetical protein